jgi:hypothetical protein
MYFFIRNRIRKRFRKLNFQRLQFIFKQVAFFAFRETFR